MMGRRCSKVENAGAIVRVSYTELRRRPTAFRNQVSVSFGGHGSNSVVAPISYAFFMGSIARIQALAGSAASGGACDSEGKGRTRCSCPSVQKAIWSIGQYGFGAGTFEESRFRR